MLSQWFAKGRIKDRPGKSNLRRDRASILLNIVECWKNKVMPFILPPESAFAVLIKER
jgi:hypothetical protein